MDVHQLLQLHRALPQEIPITHIMHGLANYAHRLGIAPKMNPTRRFAVIFWKNIAKSGRVNELGAEPPALFHGRLHERHQEGPGNGRYGLGMPKTKRLNPFGLVAHKGIKGKADLHKMLKKAYEIENKRKGFAS